MKRAAEIVLYGLIIARSVCLQATGERDVRTELASLHKDFSDYMRSGRADMCPGGSIVGEAYTRDVLQLLREAGPGISNLERLQHLEHLGNASLDVHDEREKTMRALIDIDKLDPSVKVLNSMTLRELADLNGIALEHDSSRNFKAEIAALDQELEQWWNNNPNPHPEDGGIGYDVRLVRILRAAGPAINRTEKLQYLQRLGDPAWNERKKIFKELIELEHADPNTLNDYKEYSLLHAAVMHRDAQFTEYLLDRGAQIDGRLKESLDYYANDDRNSAVILLKKNVSS